MALLSLLVSGFAIRAQQSPHIGYIYPAGGRVGSAFQIAVGGQFLNTASNGIVSGNGVQAEFVDFNRPMNQGEFNMLRDKLRELEDKERDVRRNKNSTNTWTAADEKSVAEIRAKILKNPPNRNASPGIADIVTLKILVATNAEPGERELRLVAPNGLSNPIKFCVGELPEFSSPAAKATNPDLDRFLERLGRPPQTNSPAPQRINLPCVVNGQITPGGVDRFRFAARKGQRIVIAVSARELIPYLADAVPGWFQAAVSITDAKGRELAYDDHFRFHPDPVLCCEIPHDGEYFLQIRDSIYRGREDFVYRISIGELPFVTSIFPLGGRAGEQTKIALAGWNLSMTSLTLDNSNQTVGIRQLSSAAGEKFLNTVPFAVDTLPEIFESEPNDKSSSAHRVMLPIIVNGRIEKPDDVDVFSFEGKANEVVMAEVMARRLNSPLDSTLEITDSTGKRIAFNDDWEDKGSGLETHHADSYVRVTLPSDGAYFVRLTDAQRQGGLEFGYRLRISAPQPDFALRVTPSSIIAQGGIAPITVFALRKDGFTNAISLRLHDAPGFALAGATIPANQDQIRLTIATPPLKPNEPVSLDLEGYASINGTKRGHFAIPAEDMMQAFAYRHLVPSKELRVITAGFVPQRINIRIAGEIPVKIPVGGKARVLVTGTGKTFTDRFKPELNEPPEGISLGKVSSTPDGVEIELLADPKAKPGLAGNLIVGLLPEQPRGNQKTKPAANARRTAVGVLPAIPFEIVTP